MFSYCWFYAVNLLIELRQVLTFSLKKVTVRNHTLHALFSCHRSKAVWCLGSLGNFAKAFVIAATLLLITIAVKQHQAVRYLG